MQVTLVTIIAALLFNLSISSFYRNTTLFGVPHLRHIAKEWVHCMWSIALTRTCEVCNSYNLLSHDITGFHITLGNLLFNEICQLRLSCCRYKTCFVFIYRVLLLFNQNAEISCYRLYFHNRCSFKESLPFDIYTLLFSIHMYNIEDCLTTAQFIHLHVNIY